MLRQSPWCLPPFFLVRENHSPHTSLPHTPLLFLFLLFQVYLYERHTSRPVYVPYSKPSAEKKMSTASMKEELLAAVREKEALQAKLREISENNTTAVGTASLEPAQVS